MITKLNFAHLPTPIEPLSHLRDHLGGPGLFVKRDDQTGLAFGGNKTRKLEYLLADAQNKDAQTLITAGAVQSNHCRQTAAAANLFGLDCILVLFGSPPENPDGNNFLYHLLGAEMVTAERENIPAVMEDVFVQAQADDRKPYLIPYGGSNPIGARGYVNAMHELKQQGLDPDWIVFPSSSGGTQAGMLVGAQQVGYQGKILGISVDEKASDLAIKIADLATETAQSLGEDMHFSHDSILVNDDYLGGGYAVMGEPEVEAIRLFARHEAQMLDPVYTGRAAAGLIDLVRQGFFKPSEKVLFWHTGGTPALFAKKYMHLLLN